VVRTRVGYAGGKKANPTYHSLGDHSETIQMDYDPQQVSFDALLDVFWASHNSTAKSWSRQYASFIFVHDAEQRAQAEASLKREEAKLGRKIFTEIVDYSGFTLAEDYHQKYRLRNSSIEREYVAVYPDLLDFVNSTAVTRVNGYLSGHGTPEQIESEIEALGLSDVSKEKLRRIAAVSHR
jgi:peptide-methionine (S)-S-oxide reductase